MSFTSCDNKGFHLKFANGYAISVQWGPNNYCDPHHAKFMDFQAPMHTKDGMWEADTAEVAIFTKATGHIGQVPGITDDWGDDVLGYLTADEVADLIAKVKALP